MARVAIAALSFVAAVAAPFDASANDIAGVWLIDRYSDTMLTTDGVAPPLNEDGRALYDEHLAERGDDQPQFDRTRWCAGPGVPRIMTMPYPFEIREDAGYVGFIYQWYRWHRMVDLSGAEPEALLPVTMGYPTGHWDGDTLVVRTIGTTDETILDASGLPHSEDMVLTERLRVTADGHLENRMSIEDADYYDRPWETVVTYHRVPVSTMTDDVCPDRIAMGEPPVRKDLP